VDFFFVVLRKKLNHLLFKTVLYRLLFQSITTST
jgi:hypothetical protein